MLLKFSRKRFNSTIEIATSDDSKDVFAAFDEVLEAFPDYQFTS